MPKTIKSANSIELTLTDIGAGYNRVAISAGGKVYGDHIEQSLPMRNRGDWKHVYRIARNMDKCQTCADPAPY